MLHKLTPCTNTRTQTHTHLWTPNTSPHHIINIIVYKWKQIPKCMEYVKPEPNKMTRNRQRNARYSLQNNYYILYKWKRHKIHRKTPKWVQTIPNRWNMEDIYMHVECRTEIGEQLKCRQHITTILWTRILYIRFVQNGNVVKHSLIAKWCL